MDNWEKYYHADEKDPLVQLAVVKAQFELIHPFLDLFYGTPSAGNKEAQERYLQNRFSVTRQLRYSLDESQLALDLCLFINGLPVFTFELKNSLTKQTIEDAIQQYRRDRDPKDLLFGFIPKLPVPIEEDLSKGILESVDMDSYRVEKQAVMKIQLPDADVEIEPVPTGGGGGKPELE